MKNKIVNCSELVRFGSDNSSFNQYVTFNVYNSNGNAVWVNLDSLAKAEYLIQQQLNNCAEDYDYVPEEYTIVKTVLRHTLVKTIK